MQILIRNRVIILKIGYICSTYFNLGVLYKNVRYERN